MIVPATERKQRDVGSNIMKTKFNIIKQLSDFELVEGIKSCLNNSNELYDCAILLKENNNFSVSISLLILSVEELMKSFALFQILVSEIDDREIYRDVFESTDLHSSRHNFALFFNEFFKIFDFNELKELENHTEENVQNIVIEKINIESVIENVDKEKSTFKNWFSHANTNKNKGLYVAYNKKWFSPNRLNPKDFEIAHNETDLIRNILTDFLTNFVSKDDEEIKAIVLKLKIFIKKYKSKVGIEPTT